MRGSVIIILGLLAGCASPWNTASSDRFAQDSDACRAQVAAAGSDVAKQMVERTCMAQKREFVLPLQR